MDLSLIVDNTTIEVKDLLKLMIESNNLALNIYKSYLENGKLDIDYKEDNSPVTIADKIISDLISRYLTMKYPNIPIICEEKCKIDYETRKKYNYCWLIDPIDGTKEFIKQNGEFTINIGLVKHGEPILGFVGVPNDNSIFYAIKNKGAFQFRDDTIIKINTRKQPDIPTIISSRIHNNPQTINYLEKYPNAKLITKGSSLKFLWIAQGLADIYPRFVGTMEWDTCASHIIVLEAGGRIVLADDHSETLNYNKPNLLNSSFIVFG
jgi:3'(2'), 5'-bisphosphate nucleotidase